MVHDKEEVEKKVQSFIDDIDYEKFYFRWASVFWSSMFIGHHSEPNSISYWILGGIGAISFLVSLFYLYKWFK
jgi:hypothetical protein